VGRSKAYTLLVRRIQEIAVASLKASIDIYKSLVAGGDLTLVGRPTMRMLRVIRPPPGPDGDDIWSYAEPGLSQPSPGASFPDGKSRRLFDFWKRHDFRAVRERQGHLVARAAHPLRYSMRGPRGGRKHCQPTPPEG
jgi:hypothetical protein